MFWAGARRVQPAHHHGDVAAESSSARVRPGRRGSWTVAQPVPLALVGAIALEERDEVAVRIHHPELAGAPRGVA